MIFGQSQGPILIPAASPTLGGLYEEAVKDVQSPENDDESYFDYWSRWSGQEPGNFTVEVPSLMILKRIMLKLCSLVRAICRGWK